MGALRKYLLRDAVALSTAALVLLLVWPLGRGVLSGFICGLLIGVLNAWLLVGGIERMVALVLSQYQASGSVFSLGGLGLRWFLIFVLLLLLFGVGYDLRGFLGGYLLLGFLAVVRAVKLLAPSGTGRGASTREAKGVMSR